MKRLCLFLLLTAASWAQPLRLTLGQALELAAHSNPELQVAQQGVAVAQSGITIAGQRPNPTLGLNTPLGPAERKHGIFFQLPLETGGRREARLALAESAVQEAELTQQQARLTVLNQTRNAFVELALARAALEQSRRDLEFNDRLVKAATARFEAGDVAKAEVIRAQFEREQMKRLLFPAEVRVETALLALNRLLGQPLETLIETVDDGWLFPNDADLKGPSWNLPELPVLLEMAHKQRPDLALVEQQGTTAVRQLELALANQAPAVTLQGALLYNPALPAFTYLAGVQLEIPVGSHREGEVEQAQARQQEVLRRRQSTLAAADHAVSLAYRKFQVARSQLAHDLEVLRPQADRVLYLTEKIYQIGQGDMTEVLTVGQSVQRQRQLLLSDIAQLHLALGELELAVNSTLVGGKR